VRLRGRIKRLERNARGVMIEIPRHDGTVKRFPQAAAREAFLNGMDRMGAGEDAPPEHPLMAAARNSSDAMWANSFYALDHPERWTEPVEDLSEP
jgi:hypothetical protein